MTEIPEHDPVLVVDDEENFLQPFATALKMKGVKVLTANSGKEGLKILEKDPVSVVVSDQRMPEMSGTEFLGVVSKKWPTVVTILLSGYTDLQPVVDAFKTGGASDFMPKTLARDERINAVINALHKHKEKSEEIAIKDLIERRKSNPIPRELPEHPRCMLFVKDAKGYTNFFALMRKFEYPLRVGFPESLKDFKYDPKNEEVVLIDADQVSIKDIPSKPKSLKNYPYIVLLSSKTELQIIEAKEKGFLGWVSKDKLEYASSIGDLLWDLPFIGTSVFDEHLIRFR